MTSSDARSAYLSGAGTCPATLYELLVRSAYSGLRLQNATDGCLPSGHNGPYRDPETPVRNTGHWLITWVFAWRATGDRMFYDAAQKAASYLMSAAARPAGFSFEHRNTPGKDRCNGMMGPAFSLESLVAGGRYLERADMLDLASQIVGLYPFDAKQRLWLVREVTGELRGFDRTLNHQIWFAAAVSSLNAAGIRLGEQEVSSFLDGLNQTMRLHNSGRIRHLARPAGLLSRAKDLLRDLRSPPSEREGKREIAYHCFSLYPLALLKQNVPDSPFWNSRRMSIALAYLKSDEYLRVSGAPEFVQPHIPAGFPLSFAERALVDQVFDRGDPARQRTLLLEQFDRTYDWDTNLLTKGSADPITQAARIYEITRLSDVDLRTSL